jgi:hypothetical protein
VQHGMVPADVLYVWTIVRSPRPADEVVRKDRLSHRGNVTGVKCSQPDTLWHLDLLYSTIQSFTEVASERMELATSAPNMSWAYITEVVKVMNKTNTPQLGGRKGLYVMGHHVQSLSPLMAIFLACGILLTFGWGGITAILVVVARAGFGKQLQEARKPEDSSKEAGSAKDVSISTSDLRPPT